jgi:hypothetical protein
MTNKTTIYIVAISIIVVAFGGVFYFTGLDFLPSGVSLPGAKEKPQMVEERLVAPDTQEISGFEGRFVNDGAIKVPLVPKSEAEKVIVPQAVFTLKGAYEFALPKAMAWQAGAKLSFIKSLGAVTLDGKSSQWQVVFVSKKAGAAYEIIVQEDKIASMREFESGAAGADLPDHWMDSSGAIKIIQEMPQYSNASMSAVNFFYNFDAKEWRYGISTSAGVTSVRLR